MSSYNWTAPYNSPMSLNPQLPEPQGVWSDPQYETDISDLRRSFIENYQNDLQQLGYTDAAGNYIPGGLQIAYDRQNTAAQKALADAEIAAANNAQMRGTLFSGRRADELAQMQAPTRTQISQMTEDLPRQLGALYTHASGLLGDWGRGISNAAARAVGRYVPPAAPPPPEPPPGGGGGGAGDVGPAPVSPRIPAGGPVVDTEAPLSAGEIAALGPDWQVASPTTIPSLDWNKIYGTPSSTSEKVTTKGKQAMAGGGVVDEPTDALIGEAGPEAVVPLSSGLPAAIARLMMMYQANPNILGHGAVGDYARPPIIDTFGRRPPTDVFQGPPPQMASGTPGQQAMTAPNIKAVGLKAAARILNEAAKEHEFAQIQMQQGPRHPMRPQQPINRPIPRPYALMGRQ